MFEIFWQSVFTLTDKYGKSETITVYSGEKQLVKSAKNFLWILCKCTNFKLHCNFFIVFLSI